MEQETNPVCVLSLSGGMDSGTLLAHCIEKYKRVLAVGFHYGSKHNPYEQECAELLAEHYGVELLLVDLTSIGVHLRSNLLTSGGDIPDGHYEDESMKQTVVPGRNLIFLSVLAGIAESRGAQKLAIGIHAGDHAIYPDCRPEFFFSARSAICASSDGKVEVVAPFLQGNKFTILKWGMNHGVPYELTRTCYKAQRLSCGKCGACQERLEAFRLHGAQDPIGYEQGVQQEQ